jgi:hypothetical protein
MERQPSGSFLSYALSLDFVAGGGGFSGTFLSSTRD